MFAIPAASHCSVFRASGAGASSPPREGLPEDPAQIVPGAELPRKNQASLRPTCASEPVFPRLARALILGLSLLAVALPTSALDEDAEQPLYLEADDADLDDLKAISVYTGNVIIQQGSLQIRADEVTIHHLENRQPEKIIAIGTPATYRQELEGEEEQVRAEALRMEYVTEKDEITLIEKAIVYQGEDTFRNDRIVYDRANARVKAGTSVQGKERVKILINPGKQ
jgi:lipopolysaccharide export system protein LptA